MASTGVGITAAPHPQLLAPIEPPWQLPAQPESSLDYPPQSQSQDASTQQQQLSTVLGTKRARSCDATEPADRDLTGFRHHVQSTFLSPQLLSNHTFDSTFFQNYAVTRNSSAPDRLQQLNQVGALVQPIEFAPINIDGLASMPSVDMGSVGANLTFNGNDNAGNGTGSDRMAELTVNGPWHPASLVHQQQQPQPQLQYPSPNPQQHFSGMTFGFVSPNAPTGADADAAAVAARFSTSQPASSMPRPTVAGPGMASMVERIKSIEDPAAIHPVKRRRVEGVVVGGGGGLADGGAIELQQVATTFPSRFLPSLQPQTQGAASQGPGATIDLTNDDDEPRAAPKKPGEEEVCLGMINVRIECVLVPSPRPGQTSMVFGDGYWPAIKIVLSRQHGDPTNRVVAKDYTRAVVGKLDDAACACLAPIIDAPGLSLRTETRIPTRPKAPGEEPGKPVPEHPVPLEVVLYGRRGFARTIGRHLQVHNFRLVAPSIVPLGTKMFNPHAQEPNPPAPKIAVPSSGDSSSSQPWHTTSGAASNRTLDDIRTEVMNVFDSLAQTDELPEKNASDLVTTPLLKHQKQGLYFLLAREEEIEAQMANKHMTSFWKPATAPSGASFWRNIITLQKERDHPPATRGGILADMMGLGKTLSILSLITSTYHEAAAWAAQPPTQPMLPKQPKAGASSAAISGSHALGLTRLALNAKTTLLICPLSTVTNWEEQIKQHIVPGKLRYHIYHGPNRIKSMKKLSEFDLVITTYGSVSSELSSRSKGKSGLHPLEEMGWFRVVLDEAHMIREHNTLMFKAVYRLQASRRWAVTGTPVQNRLDDFAALLAFLRLKPFDDRSKFLRHIVEPFKNCDPEIVPKLRILVDTITLRRLKDKINLPPRTDEVVKLDFSPEERHIYDLFAKNAKDRVKVLAGPGIERALGGQTYIHILRSILRLRLLCAHGKDLLNQDDLNALQGMTADMAIDLDDDDDGQSSSGLTERQAYEMFRLMQDTNNDGCVNCGKKLSSSDNGSAESEVQEDVLGYMNPCFHVVCRACYRPFVQRCRSALPEGQTHGPCPVCNTPRQVYFVALHRSRVDVEHMGSVNNKAADDGRSKLTSGYSGPHTKTRALVEELLKNKAESALIPDEPPYKSVVFSGWTSHLDLIQMAFEKAGITYTRLDGTMTRVARGHAMDSFREDNNVQVILVSIMAGGLGLNLTAGNSVFVMEPQYNPAAEAQAVDRVHRLGQKRPVRTVRFIMRDSFEEKMLELQDKKKKLASLSMDGKGRALDKAEAARQKLMDLRSLFK